MAQLSQAHLQTMMNNRWFAKLPENLRAEILERAKLQQLKDGELLYHQGQASTGWYGLVEGAIKIGSTSPDGKQALLTFVQPGAWIGEISLFDGLSRPNNAISHGASTMLIVSASDFQALLTQHPELYRHFILLQCQRMRLLFLMVESLNAFPLEERLTGYVLNFINGYGQPHQDGIELNLHLPQEELSQLLGVTRQRIGQLLKEWERNGWLHFHYGRMVITHAWLDLHKKRPA